MNFLNGKGLAGLPCFGWVNTLVAVIDDTSGFPFDLRETSRVEDLIKGVGRALLKIDLTQVRFRRSEVSLELGSKIL
jgi:hypothetical protein